MAKRVAILTFSGTGNTAAVAGMLASGLREAGHAVDEYRIEDLLNNKREFSPAGYGLIGFGYPSYGFNVPPIVTSFARGLDGSAHPDVFLFMTCAGPCYINDIASYGLKKLLVKRGFRVVYESIFVMPANVLIRYPHGIVRQLVEAAQERSLSMAADLSAGVQRVRDDGLFARLLRWTYVWCEGPMLRFLALDFRAGRSCTLCRKCVDNCPKRNISVKNNKIRFGTRCAACYRCVYGCPRRAISARLLNAAILKDFYCLAAKSSNDSTGDTIVTKDTKGIFRTLRRYLGEF